MIKTIMLDDNVEYAIVEEKVINGVTYTLFVNVNDGSDICFRKTITASDGEDYYVGLKDKDEFDLVSLHFTKELLNNN